jgi:hypothetical protein
VKSEERKIKLNSKIPLLDRRGGTKKYALKAQTNECRGGGNNKNKK